MSNFLKQIVEQISKEKEEPEWMLEKRLEALKIFDEKKMPSFGPNLSDLILEEINYFIKTGINRRSKNWEDIPSGIREIYDKLGIPEAEKKSLGGVGAQYESEIIYHNLKKHLEDLGVIFLDMDEAVKTHPEMVQEYFMTRCVSPSLHKFSALHAAVWSGGTFIYIPKNVEVDLPLQAYFRMNSKKAGQFEHTLIIADEGSSLHYIEGCSAPQYDENSLHVGCVEIFVMKNAKVKYSSIENWSKNTYNLNTKRGIVEEGGTLEWINGNLGSKVSMLYPCSILLGDNSKTEYLGIAYAGNGQYQDTGCKVVHIGENTSSYVVSKGISISGGVSSYRGVVKIDKGAKNAITSVKCDGLMMDDNSKAFTYPSMEVSENNVKVSHEAVVGKVGEEELFYLMSRGLNESEAMKMIVAGFIEPIVKELPLEYAAELNKLIQLEIENSVL